MLMKRVLSINKYIYTQHSLILSHRYFCLIVSKDVQHALSPLHRAQTHRQGRLRGRAKFLQLISASFIFLGLPHVLIPLLLSHQLSLVVVTVVPHPVQCDWGREHGVSDAKAFTNCKSLRSKLGTEVGRDGLHLVDVLLHDGGHIEGVDQVENGIHLLISLLHSQGHPVSDQPIGKGLGCVLDQVGLLEHPRGVGASLASSCHFLAKSSEELDLSLLKKAVKIGGVRKGGRIRLDHGWGVLAQVAQVLLGHLLHKDRVVTLSCHCCVRQPKESAEPVARKVALASAPLSAHRHDLFEQPGSSGLDRTAHGHHLFVFGTILLLECPAIFHMIQANVHSNNSRQKGHEGPLLQLVDKDGGVGLSSWSDSQSRSSIPNSDADGSLCSADGHGGDADPARQQLVGHRQEPCPSAANFGREFTLLTHVTISVQQSSPWHTDIVKAQLRVVDAVEAHLVAHVLDGDARDCLQVIVPHPDQDGVDALVLSLHYQLRHHHHVLGVDSAICDPVLLG